MKLFIENINVLSLGSGIDFTLKIKPICKRGESRMAGMCVARGSQIFGWSQQGSSSSLRLSASLTASLCCSLRLCTPWCAWLPSSPAEGWKDCSIQYVLVSSLSSTMAYGKHDSKCVMSLCVAPLCSLLESQSPLWCRNTGPLTLTFQSVTPCCCDGKGQGRDPVAQPHTIPTLFSFAWFILNFVLFFQFRPFLPL